MWTRHVYQSTDGFMVYPSGDQLQLMKLHCNTGPLYPWRYNYTYLGAVEYRKQSTTLPKCDITSAHKFVNNLIVFFTILETNAFKRNGSHAPKFTNYLMNTSTQASAMLHLGGTILYWIQLPPYNHLFYH